jgi:hypothetical protein
MRYSARAVCIALVVPLTLGPVALGFAQDSVSAAPGASASTANAGPSPARRAPVRSGRQRPASADARLSGFETLADQSTRLFVDLSQPIAYETKIERRTITYILKGARVGRRNDTNPLVTVHFNTPVTSARLAPHGHDLWFVIALRAAVTPVVTLDPDKDGGTMMRIEFPKGDYVPSASGEESDATGTAGSSPNERVSPGDPTRSGR